VVLNVQVIPHSVPKQENLQRPDIATTNTKQTDMRGRRGGGIPKDKKPLGRNKPIKLFKPFNLSNRFHQWFFLLEILFEICGDFAFGVFKCFG